MQAALARHDAILRQAIEGHDGVVFTTVGGMEQGAGRRAEAPAARTEQLIPRGSVPALSRGAIEVCV